MSCLVRGHLRGSRSALSSKAITPMDIFSEGPKRYLLGLHEHAHIFDHHVPSNPALLQPVSKLLKQLRRCPDIHRSARHCLSTQSLGSPQVWALDLFPEVIDANVAELVQGGRLGLVLNLDYQRHQPHYPEHINLMSILCAFQLSHNECGFNAHVK